MCLYLWDFTFNHSKNEDDEGENEKNHIVIVYDLGFEMYTNIVNIRIVSIWLCFYVLATPKQHLKLNSWES